jgi:dTDP-4-amino-4,6-dideoxygalactose transaminase
MRELAPQPAGEVLLPAFTYTGLPHLVVWAGLTPRFCDIDPQTHSLCPRSVEASIGERTGLILGVHHAHAPCDIDALQELSHRHQVPLLLDAAHGLGGTYRDKPLGSFGRAEVFSLHATKMINGFEGGYITTDDDELANTLRLARTFGFVRKDYVQGLGLNAKLNEVHAGLALASLDDLDAVIASNRERVEMYLRTFSSIPGVSLVPYGEEHSYNYEFNTLHVPPDWPLTRDELVSLLRAENALCWPYFSPPLYRCSTRPTGIPPSDPLPVTEALSQRFIQMPAGELTSVTDIEHIARLVSFLHDNAAAIRQALDKVV